jgi:hypothetical protein
MPAVCLGILKTKKRQDFTALPQKKGRSVSMGLLSKLSNAVVRLPPSSLLQFYRQQAFTCAFSGFAEFPRIFAKPKLFKYFKTSLSELKLFLLPLS